MNIKIKFQENKKAILILILIVGVGGIWGWRTFVGSKNQPQYQTAKVEKGTLVISVSESGQVAVANKISVTTQASGLVKEINVKNGDAVTQGQKLAVVALDATGQQRQAQTWSSYLQAKTTLDSENAKLYSLQSSMFSKWKTYTDIATNSTYQNSDGTPNTSNRILTQFTTVQDDWLYAEAVYKNQQGVISQAGAALNSNWLSYQNSSAVITAPMAGTISDLTVVPGMLIGSQSTTTGNPLSQTVGYVTTLGTPIISINLSEVDATQVKIGDKVTVTFDALPGKTFTGKVLGINTTGVVNSGVTTYPATIVLDTQNDKILSNMSTTAQIIIDTKDNALLVPSAAVQTQNGQTVVRVLVGGKISQVPVETGVFSETQTEIISGLTEGEDVVIGALNSSQQSGSTSPFGISPFGGRGFGGGTRGGGVQH